MSEFTVNELAEVPLNFTAVAPVKPEPLRVTLVPTGPLVGVKELMLGATVTVKLVELVAVPPGVVTLIDPVVAPLGTEVVICVSVATVKVATVPLIVTLVPTGPLVGAKELITGGATTVKLLVLVPVPAVVVTLMGPVVALAGTL